MKNKTQVSQLILLFAPFLILITAFEMDRLEVLVARSFGALNAEPYLWLLTLIRLVFAVMVFAGITFLLNSKREYRTYSFLWLVLGFISVFFATPLGNYLRSALIRTPSLTTFPNRLFFMAGAFLIMGGSYSLIQFSNTKRKK